MEPTAERTPALALPQPASEQGVTDGFPGDRAPETFGINPEIQSGIHPPALAGAINPLPAAQPLAPSSVQAGSGVQQVPTAATSDDMSSSALDEEWITKAKAIIEQTKNDPYLESKELSKTKADYLRIRYNKQIKVAEDSVR